MATARCYLNVWTGADHLATTLILNEALMNQILDTGHGTGIDAQTLKGVIHDEAAFARWAGEGADPVLNVIGPLFRGDLDTAQTALDWLSIDAGPNVQFRLHALGATSCATGASSPKPSLAMS